MNRVDHCLDKYSVPLSGQPILFGHLFRKFFDKISIKSVHESATFGKRKNAFTPIKVFKVSRLHKLYKKKTA